MPEAGSRTEPFSDGLTRRTFLRRGGAAGAAVLGGTLWATGPAARRARAVPKKPTPLRHVLFDCQENRSFDHYYGFAPKVQAAGFGVPPGYTQPDGNGGRVAPFHTGELATPDIGHSWTAVHREYDNGAMDGFVTTDGREAVRFYTAAEIPFYYSLIDEFTLCGNYFCSLLGPTWPNRFYFAGGTSGGITTNGIWGYGVFDWPIILDLLDAAGVTWKVYNLGFDSVPFGNTDNVFVFWKNFAHDERTRGSKGGLLNDIRTGDLPQVAWLIPSFARGQDEHPPADITVGMGIQQEIITALRDSPLWDSSAYFLTYDEHGGYFDHVAPLQVDAFGLGIRVPNFVVSPWAKKGHVEAARYEHTSTLKFLERLHGLPTLASVNHRFDAGTPVGGNFQAAPAGATVGPPAPPRDNRPEIGDLFECFSF